jgi:hypothetical protein
VNRLARPKETFAPPFDVPPTSNPRVVEDALMYHRTHGVHFRLRPFSATPSTVTVDQDRGRVAGLAFHQMKHDPDHPDVKAAYDALKRETLAQYEHVVNRGLKVLPWQHEGQPYQSSRDLFDKVKATHTLYYYPTKAGYGQAGDTAVDNHPMLEQAPGHPEGVVYNDLFRAVHDYFAHAMHGHQFGPTGELRAWHEHAKMYSPLARKALTTETHGQNSWVNFGPHEPWKKPVTERPYAEQKAGLLPEHAHPAVKLARPKVHPALTPLEEHAVAAMRHHDDPSHFHILADHVEEAVPDSPWHPVVRGFQSGNYQEPLQAAFKIHNQEKRPLVNRTREDGAVNATAVHLPHGPARLRVSYVPARDEWTVEAHSGKPRATAHTRTVTREEAVAVLKSMPGGADNLLHMAVAAHLIPLSENESVAGQAKKMRLSRKKTRAAVGRKIKELIASGMDRRKAVLEALKCYKLARVKLARVRLARLGPARAATTHTGEQVFHHEFADDAGKRMGTVSLVPRGDALHVHWMGLEGAGSGEQAGAAGVRHMRSLLPQIAQAYPQHNVLIGRRAGGAHEGDLRGVELGKFRLAREWKVPGRPSRHTESMGGLATDPRVMADYLQEHGLPGAHVARVSDENLLYRSSAQQTRVGDIHEVVHGGGTAEAQLIHDPNAYIGPGPTKRPTYYLRVKHTDRDGGDWPGEKPRITHRAKVENLRQLLGLLSDFPPATAAKIARAAKAHGMPIGDPSVPVKLARVVHTGAGGATRAAQTDNHAARASVVKRLLAEAGISPATVRSVLAHTDERGVRPGVSAFIGAALDPSLARYVAAWMGLLAGEKRITVFHPDDNGEDTMHVIDSPMPSAHVGDYLRRSGVPSFTLEQRAAGTRVYVVNPLDLIDVPSAARGISGSHSTLRGTAVRLGAGQGSDADARATFRTVIRDAEARTGLASRPDAGGTGPLD